MPLRIDPKTGLPTLKSLEPKRVGGCPECAALLGTALVCERHTKPAKRKIYPSSQPSKKKKRAPGAGRKPTDGAPRREQLNLRLHFGDRARVEAAAAYADRDPSEWARLVVMAAVRAFEDARDAAVAAGRRAAEERAAELASRPETAEPAQGGGSGRPEAPKRVVAQCVELDPLGGGGCELLAGHDGPHELAAGRTWANLTIPRT